MTHSQGNNNKTTKNIFFYEINRNYLLYRLNKIIISKKKHTHKRRENEFSFNNIYIKKKKAAIENRGLFLFL